MADRPEDSHIRPDSDDDADITLVTVWRTAHPLVKRLCIWMPPIGLVMFGLGNWGDQAGWWADRSFLTNLYSGMTSLMFGLPFGLLVVTRIAASATVYAEKIEQRLEADAKAHAAELEAAAQARARELEAAADARAREEQEAPVREVVAETRRLYEHIQATNSSIAAALSAVPTARSPIEDHGVGRNLRAILEQARYVSGLRKEQGLSVRMGNPSLEDVLKTVERAGVFEVPSDRLKLAWKYFVRGWQNVVERDQRDVEAHQ